MASGSGSIEDRPAGEDIRDNRDESVKIVWVFGREEGQYAWNHHLVLGRSLPAPRTVTPVRASGSKCQSWLVELLGRMPRSGHRTEAREDAASAAQGRPRAFPLFYLESAHQVPIWCGASTGHGSRGLSNRRASGPEHKSYYNDAFGTGYGGWNTTSKLLITAE